MTFKIKPSSYINLQLTQESGQTSQPKWLNLETDLKNQYQELLLVKNSYLNNDMAIPTLVKLSQDDIASLNIDIEVIRFDGENDLIGKNLKLFVKDLNREISDIYDLNFDLNKFYDFLREDENLAPTIDFCKGLRLFKAKNKLECIISSICSSNNSILRWTKSINDIKHNWGKSYKFPSGTFYDFPDIQTLLNAPDNEFIENKLFDKNIEDCYSNLKSCGVGYRCDYIKKSLNSLLTEIDIDDIAKMKYDEAFETITKLNGVGPKVADCILLYGYGMNEAFPTDVWIKRIISYLYFDNKDIPVKKIREFGMEQFGEYAGYTQLYLFHYSRMSGLMDKIK